MKAASVYKYDTTLSSSDFVKLEEVPEPTLVNDTDVLVRIGGAGVCRTDLQVIEEIWRQKVNVKLPYILGHENAGWVEEVGKGVQGFKRGDPVICHPLISNTHDFLMAIDMRDAVAELRWVQSVSVDLLDHFSAPD